MSQFLLSRAWRAPGLLRLKPTFPDTVGYWSRHTKFPGSSDTNHVPHNFKNLTPLKFTFHIVDNDLEAFLSPTKWSDKGRYIRLNSEVFESASYHVPASNTCPTVDKCLRDQLTDNLITDEFIDTTEKLVNLGLNIPKNNPGASDDSLIDLLVKNLELISTSVILSAASNLRGRHTILTSIVKNKLTLRDEVLKAHNGGGGFCSH